MVQGTEGLLLAVSVILAPIIIYVLRRIDLPSKQYFALALVALTLSYLFTVLEGFFAHDLLNVLEHAMLAISGVLFAVSAWLLRVHWYSRRDG